MKSKEKLLNTQREMQLFYLKKLYRDAFFWHLIHKGYSMECAELEVIIQMQN